MTSDPSHGWQRLGELLIRRRLDLDPRYRNRQVFADERGVEYRIISDLERARRTNFHAVTLAEAERAYALESGAISRFLDGEDQELQLSAYRSLAVVPSPPKSLEPSPEDIFPDVEPEMRPLIAAHLRTLRHLYRIAAVKGPDMSGSAIFPDSPHEAERWDRLVVTGYMEKAGDDGYTVPELLFLMAVGRVFDDQYRAAAGQPDRRRKALIRIT